MPGRLLSMEQSQDLKKDRSHAVGPQLPPKPDFTQKSAAPHANGSGEAPSNRALVNGAPVQQVPSAANGDPAVQHASATSLEPPPELDQEWRQSDSNKSMSTLIERLSQQCFADLSTMLTEMSETTFGQQGAQPNGVPLSSNDQNQSSLQKKRSFMQFANGQRDRFIKTLVLTDWAQNAGDDMAKLVDIKVWQEKQANEQRRAIDFIGITKNDTRGAKMPNPNIEGALELLATGRAARVPDLGYLPPKRLTAKQLLRTLQNMNVALSTRLNLHEELPPHFNDFSIANGRATFRVPTEFEVDISVADEDPSTQFFFIDIRFLFSPKPMVSHVDLRKHIEGHLNKELESKGLRGCYDFLHNFVLTHKINMLRDQTERIQREKLTDKWHGCVFADRRNRVLTIQYWAGLPGKKSWLEFGVSTGKDRNAKSSRSPTPRVVARWFRRNEEVKDTAIEIDWKDIDVENILSMITSRHASWLLNEIRERLKTLAGPNSKMEVVLTSSDQLADGSSLKLSLPGMLAPLTVRFESITGRLSISPGSIRITKMERDLNGNANPDYGEALANLVCVSLQDRIDKASKLAEWQDVRHNFRQEALRNAFGKNFRTYKAYFCSRYWSPKWALFVTCSLSGEEWWIARIEDRAATAGSALIKDIKDARRLSGTEILPPGRTIPRALLLQIEKMAVAEVSFAVLSQQFTSMNIDFRTEKLASLTFEDTSSIATSLPKLAVFFRGSSLFKDSRGQNFIVDCVRFTHCGLPASTAEGDGAADTSHELRLTVKTGRLQNLKEYLSTKSRDADIAMNESNALALKLRTSFGQPYMDQLISRLKGCDRLDRYLADMRRFKFKCNTLGFHKVAFTYAEAPEATAVVTFSGQDEGFPATLKLEPEDNAHRRARSVLEKAFNTKLGEPFHLLCQLLSASTHVHRGLDQIEARHSTKEALVVHVRNPVRYQLVYRAPLPSYSFTVELKTRGDAHRTISVWKFSADKKSRSDLLASDVGKALLDLAGQKGDDWWGFEDGTLCAMPERAGEVLLKVDDVMQKYAGTATTTSQPANGVKQEAQSRPQTTKQQSPQKPQPHQRPPSTQQKTPQQNAKPPPAPVANMTGNPNAAAGRNHQGKVKKEIIELD